MAERAARLRTDGGDGEGDELGRHLDLVEAQACEVGEKRGGIDAHEIAPLVDRCPPHEAACLWSTTGARPTPSNVCQIQLNGRPIEAMAFGDAP